ncbi:MAG: helix-turn-helix domain-containing protein [Brucella sp.]
MKLANNVEVWGYMSWLQTLPSWGKVHEVEDGGIMRSLTGANQIKFTTPEPFALILTTPQPRREVAVGTDRTTVFHAPAGGVELIPAGTDMFARWQAQKECILTTITPCRLKRLAGLEFGYDDIELIPTQPGATDPVSSAIAKLMHQEFIRPEGPSANAMEPLNVLFWLQMLRARSSIAVQQRSMRHQGGLPPLVVRRIEEFIDANISSSLAIDTLAVIAGCSPSHLVRTFRKTTGIPPHQFILQRRLAHARQMIKDNQLELRTIAALCGFASQSHMTSLMRKYWGVTPKQMRP